MVCKKKIATSSGTATWPRRRRRPGIAISLFHVLRPREEEREKKGFRSVHRLVTVIYFCFEFSYFLYSFLVQFGLLSFLTCVLAT